MNPKMTQRIRQKWISETTWICTGHIPAPNLPLVQGKCWFCGAVRPPLDGRTIPKPPKKERKSLRVPVGEVKIVAVETIPGPARCAWKGCTKEARPGSKYCSRTCSNKNARSAYRKSKKDEGRERAIRAAEVSVGLVEGNR